jgi:hypothetical protein
MTDAIDQIAEKLIDAAYDNNGRPPDKVGVYIAKVARQQDVPAYFRKKAALARETRTRELWYQLQNMAAADDSAAEFIIWEGLQSLEQDAKLPADQRRVIEHFMNLWRWEDEVEAELEKEPNFKKTPDWIAQPTEADPIQAIAAKLISAAYERFGRPPKPGGIYITKAILDEDVPAYFLQTVAFAREPRSRALWERAREFRFADAAMVMDAGLAYLELHATLPADQRSVIDEIRKFKEWQDAVDKEVTDEINEHAHWEAGLDD